MCTVAWLSEPGGYRLFFNRDELRTRSAGLQPAVSTRAGVRFVAPRDPDGGGTWLSVNELGVTVGLLNAWSGAEREPARAFESRGLVVLGLADARSAAEARARLEEQDLRAVRGFRLAAFGLGEEPLVLAWDGERLACERAERPLSSSGFDAEGAARARAAALAELAGGGAVDARVLERFQTSHRPERGALSPCMHRTDARTVSASRIAVGPAGVAFEYAPGPPCTTAFGPAVLLPPRAGAQRSGRARGPRGAGGT